MAKNRKRKEEELERLARNIENAQSVVFSHFSQMTVKEQEKLRRECREKGVGFEIAKKTLLSLALARCKVQGALDISGTIGIAFGMQDQIAPSKVIAKYMNEFKGRLVIEGGIMNNALITREEVVELSKLASKDELYARFVSAINAPLSRMARALSGNLVQFVQLLNAIKEAKS